MKENGTYVGSTFDDHFVTSLYVKQVSSALMTPGNYIFMIDPIWDESVKLDDKYKDVLIDIYAPEEVSI